MKSTRHGKLFQQWQCSNSKSLISTRIKPCTNVTSWMSRHCDDLGVILVAGQLEMALKPFPDVTLFLICS